MGLIKDRNGMDLTEAEDIKKRLQEYTEELYKKIFMTQITEGFPPPPDKDLESPSSTRLEALVPSRDSRARMHSPSPRAWRPDFPGAAREAP